MKVKFTEEELKDRQLKGYSIKPMDYDLLITPGKEDDNGTKRTNN
jgi:hypothetical protein